MMDLAVSPTTVFFLALSIALVIGLLGLSFALLRKNPRRWFRVLLAVILMIGAIVVALSSLHGATELYVERAADRLHYGATQAEVVELLQWFRETRVPLTSVPSNYTIDEMASHKERIYRYDFVSQPYSVYVVYDDSWRLIAKVTTVI